MTSESWDVVVIGGGINGAGVAQAAAAAGYSTLLLEKNPQPGKETSSRSSKLIHGGLRYLESLELSLVYESLRERELLLKLAPDLVHRQTFNIPVYRDTSRSQWALCAGLTLYALMAGPLRNRFHRLGKKEAQSIPGIRKKDLRAVFRYEDAQTDDAKLTRAVVESARSLGAEIRCDTEMTYALVEPERIDIGIRTEGREHSLESRVLINAAGPWVSEVNRRIRPTPPMPDIDLVQGAHLVLEEAVEQAWYLESPTDGRAVFLLPWKGRALLGTTETLYQGDPSQVHCLDEERDYLLQVQAHYFPQRSERVMDDMAGLRVLPRQGNSLFKRSREILLTVDDRHRPRVVGMVGGKLTVYRHTAEKVMALLGPVLPSRRKRADTRQCRLDPPA